MKYRWMIVAQFVLFAIAWPLAHATGVYDQLPATGQAILRFGLAYGLGAAIFALSGRLSFNILGVPVLFLVAGLFNDTIVFEIAFNIALAYFVMWAAYVKIPALNRIQGVSDISYGIYIYHWAVMQWLFYVYPNLDVVGLTAVGLPVTIMLSYASWHFVEKPTLKLKKPFGRHLKRQPKSKDAFIPAE